MTFSNHLDQPVPDFPGEFSVGATVCTPQVHTEETSEHSGGLPSYRDFAISGCKNQIEAARRVLVELTDDAADNRLRSFDGCRSVAWFVRHRETGKIRVASSRCGLRWCPLCIRSRRYILTKSVGSWLKRLDKPKFLTLTLKHSSAPLSEQIDSLYHFFKEFKRRKFFKKRLLGGVWFFQVKKSDTDGLWHPHLHILFEGRFLPHAEVSKIWSEITHGSSVVDIRAVNNPKKAADYVARYASAPADLSSLCVSDGVELVESLHNRRIVGTFGTGKVVKLTAEKPEDSEQWQKVGSFGLLSFWSKFNENFQAVIKAWKSGGVCDYIPPEDPPDPVIDEVILATEPESYRQGVLPFMSL